MNDQCSYDIMIFYFSAVYILFNGREECYCDTQGFCRKFTNLGDSGRFDNPLPKSI